MNKHWIRLGGMGLAVFLIAMVINFPAAWGLYLLQDRVPSSVKWQEVSGTVFDTSINHVEVILPGNRRAVLDNIEVRTSVLPLLLGRAMLEFRVRTGGEDIAGQARLRRAEWSIPLIEGVLPLELLTGVVPELGSLGMTGRIVFHGSGLSGKYEDLPGSGRLVVTVEDLRLDLIEADRPLGNYYADLEAGEETGIAGSVRTISTDAMLNIEGTIRSDPGGVNLHFIGKAWVDAGASDPVRSLLPLLGVVENDQATIDWQGTL